MTRTIVALAVCGLAASMASAGTISIADIGGGVLLNSGPLSATVFGQNQTVWTTASLASAHTSINASGIATEGKVTIVAADTDRGLSLMALVDRETGTGGTGPTGNLHMDSVGNGSNLAYINATGGITVTPNGGGSRIATGDFVWNSTNGGNGFAWAQLLTGNTMTFRFNKIAQTNLGLLDPGTFQFVTWTGSAWALVPIAQNLLSFTSTNDYGFSAVVIIPLPAGAGMAGASLLGLPLLRRRRTLA